ncbi:MAG: alanine racemase [Oscillospiraceae bacterium]|nr:alanine racemase [Oscillospiraceae bacterium]
MNSFIIERDKIRSNAEEIFSRAGDATVIAVVKGRAYGFGIAEFVPLLHECGVRFFGVTDVADALEIKKLALPETDIIMLRSTALCDELSSLIQNDIIITIGSTEAAVNANSIALEKGTTARAHVKIDTGMGRYGFSPDDTEQIYSVYTKFSNISVSGLFTHLSSAFKNGNTTKKQLEKLSSVEDELSSRGVSCGTIHFANSSYLFKRKKPVGDAVRIGSAFTGRLPCKAHSNGLSRVGHLEGNICEIHWLPKGSKVGYSGAYTAKQPTRAAVVPIGYSDGFCVEKCRDTYRFKDGIFYILSDIKRTLFKKSVYVSVNGYKSKVLGHIGMTHTVCDVTDIPCEIGDNVLFDINPVYVSPDVYKEYI